VRSKTLIAIGLACLLGAQSGFAGDRVEVHSAQALGGPPGLARAARSMANDVLQGRIGDREPFVDDLPPAMQQRMQESLEAYFRALIMDLVGGGDGGGGSSEGACLPRSLPGCNAGDIDMGVVGGCMGRSKSACRGDRATQLCQPKDGGRAYKRNYGCYWWTYERPN
jgi:hypothetical protein